MKIKRNAPVFLWKWNKYIKLFLLKDDNAKLEDYV